MSVLEKYTHSIRLLTSMPDWENNKFKSSGKSFQAAIARPDQLAPDHVLTRSSHPLPHPESSSTSSRSFSSQDLRSLIDIFGKAAPVGIAPGRRLFLRACAGTAATPVLQTFTVDNFSCRDVASSVIVPQESGHPFILCFLQCPDLDMWILTQVAPTNSLQQYGCGVSALPSSSPRIVVAMGDGSMHGEGWTFDLDL